MKIGLIAMSGIRVCDQELLDLGLTLPGFVERSQAIASLPSLGLLTLAGMTPKKHSIAYFESEDIKDNLPKDLDLIAISTYSAQIFEAYDIADKYNAMNIPVIIGGTHVTMVPDEAIEHCNSVIIGEGENCWLDVLNDYENNTPKKFYGSLDISYDLNNAPLPAFELLDIDKYNRITIQTSRGCPHLCEFCASSTVISKAYKQKPMDKVLAEIDKVESLWKRPFIEFADDNTFIDKEYWKTILPEIKKRKIKWFTETDISVGEDLELLKLMRESGCAEVLIGLESPNKEFLNNIETVNNWKLGQWDKYKQAVNNIQNHGIRVNGCFIVGLDGQDKGIFKRILDYSKELELYDVQITLLTPFPKTPLYNRLEKENRLLDKKAWQKCTLFDLNFKPDKMTFEELNEGFRNLGTELYSDELTNWRKDTFRKKYLRSKGVQQENSVKS